MVVRFVVVAVAAAAVVAVVVAVAVAVATAVLWFETAVLCFAAVTVVL